MCFPGGAGVKNPPANAGDTRDVSSITGSGASWSRKCQSAPVFLPVKFHGQRSLVGTSPWGHKKSDTIKHIHIHTENSHKIISMI